MVTDGLNEGFTKVIIPVKQKWLVNLLKTHFPTITVTELLLPPDPKVINNWEIEANLQMVVDKLDQLAGGD